jgi:hypothetical protein
VIKVSGACTLFREPYPFPDSCKRHFVRKGLAGLLKHG